VREEGIVGYAFFLVVNGEDSFSDFHLNDSVAFVQKESADAFDRQVVDPFTSCGCPETLYTVTVDFALPDGMGEEDSAILMVVPVTSDQEALPLGVGTLPLRDLTSTSTSSSSTSTSSATSTTSTTTDSTESSMSSTSTSGSSMSSTSSGSSRMSQTSSTSSSTSESTVSSNTQSTTSSSTATSGSSESTATTTTGSTSSTSTTTSSTTTEQPIAAQVVFEVAGQVDNCEEYSQNAQVQEALATALADAAGIPVEWVLVSIVCLDTEGRRLAVNTENANVVISFIIEVPTDASSEDFNMTISSNATANLSNLDDFNGQDAQDVTLSIASAIAQLSNEELEDAIQNAQSDLGITQQLTVTAVDDPVIIVKTSTTTSTSSASSGSSGSSGSTVSSSSTTASSTTHTTSTKSSVSSGSTATTSSTSTGSTLSSESSTSTSESSTSSSSSLSTMTTSSTPVPVLAEVRFVVRITVSNGADFASDAAAVQALRRAVADFLGLPVGFVRVELTILRRLAQILSESAAAGHLRHLTSSSSEVDVNFVVAIPASNDLGKTATEAANDAAATVSGTTAAELTTLIADEFVEAGVESYSLAVQEISETNVVLYGSTHTSTSTASSSSSSTSTTDAPDQPNGEGPGSEETGANAGVVAVIVILVLFALLAPCAIFIWYVKRQAAHKGEDVSVKEMLNRAVAEARRLRVKSKGAAGDSLAADAGAAAPPPPQQPNSWTDYEV